MWSVAIAIEVDILRDIFNTAELKNFEKPEKIKNESCLGTGRTWRVNKRATFSRFQMDA